MNNEQPSHSRSREDWFTKGLKERLPSEVRESFSEQQLQALKVAFGARRWGKHPVDLRGTLDLWRWRYYFVLLIGRNRRELTRREQRISRVMGALSLVGFLLFSVLVGLLVLYVLKSALGINLMPNTSLGLWDWLKSS
ncbi:3-phosphoshikimate 1-carboxyvinyltransferase [Halopseudomonas nanhaiensis]|uniref:3-phosphoshikimate 1-carboxyvinyltransferase n=1 Tax=Halopseudomonas nanhaiensis TaxID=2830842 RepID=UPI001CBDDCCE|nr:3-phosphoshikimate 1-carboxyvinyltransferase [Halopseudomonas nanhaiensis]UAW99484.1 3-phosphoshikimate 1-carboxyvinyltransferase [Halopseudomonas nanhaiensis]